MKIKATTMKVHTMKQRDLDTNFVIISYHYVDLDTQGGQSLDP
jgi:hypothetical protein